MSLRTGWRPTPSAQIVAMQFCSAVGLSEPAGLRTACNPPKAYAHVEGIQPHILQLIQELES